MATSLNDFLHSTIFLHHVSTIHLQHPSSAQNVFSFILVNNVNTCTSRQFGRWNSKLKWSNIHLKPRQKVVKFQIERRRQFGFLNLLNKPNYLSRKWLFYKTINEFSAMYICFEWIINNISGLSPHILAWFGVLLSLHVKQATNKHITFVLASVLRT